MNYVGDTFIRNYSIETDTGEYIFEEGDILKAAFINKNGEIVIEKTVNLTADDKDVNVIWEANEMKNLEAGTYILETEITTSNWRKTFQEKVKMTKDYIVGE